MDESLYFIPLLADALESPDVEASLKRALAEINRRGIDDRYAAGFRNFVHFMDEVCLRHQNIERHLAHELIVMFAYDFLEPAQDDTAASHWIESCSEWRAERKAFHEETGVNQTELPLATIQFFRGRQLLLETVMPSEGGCGHIRNVIAGHYMVRLDIGMTVWEGELTARELLWSEAFGERDLQMAAQTTDLQQQPTREMVLLDGALSIRVFAGIESGSIEIELCK